MVVLMVVGGGSNLGIYHWEGGGEYGEGWGIAGIKANFLYIP